MHSAAFGETYLVITVEDQDGAGGDTDPYGQLVAGATEIFSRHAGRGGGGGSEVISDTSVGSN